MYVIRCTAAFKQLEMWQLQTQEEIIIHVPVAINKNRLELRGGPYSAWTFRLIPRMTARLVG